MKDAVDFGALSDREVKEVLVNLIGRIEKISEETEPYSRVSSYCLKMAWEELCHVLGLLFEREIFDPDSQKE